MSTMASASTRQSAVALYLKIGSARAVANQFPPYCHQTIINWVRDASKPIKSKGGSYFSYEDDRDIFKTYLRWHNVARTSVHHRLSRTTIRRAIRRMLAEIGRELL